MSTVPSPSRSRPPTEGARRWAPWWVYLVVILGANYLRQALLPPSTGPLPEGAVFVVAPAQAALLFVLVTAVHRATRTGRS